MPARKKALDAIKKPDSVTARKVAANFGGDPAMEEHLARVRRICLSMPGATEKLSHGEPTFFANKRVFAMFDNHHHKDSHIAVWIPAAPGVQEMLVHTDPDRYFRPPYVGVKGWVGVELEQVNDDELRGHILDAWRLIAPKKPR